MGINTHVLLEYGCLFMPSEGENPAVDFLKTLQDRNDGEFIYQDYYHHNPYYFLPIKEPEILFDSGV